MNDLNYNDVPTWQVIAVLLVPTLILGGAGWIIVWKVIG